MAKPLHFNTAVYLLPVPILLFLVLAIVGCVSTSPGIPNIYLVALNSGSDFIRIGYYGICSRAAGTVDCMPITGVSARSAANHLTADANAMNTLYTLRSKVFLPLVVISGGDFLVSCVALGLYKRCEKRTASEKASPTTMSRSRIIALCAAWSSAALMLSAAWGVTVSALALQVASAGSLYSEHLQSGTALQALQWLAAGFSCVYALGLGTMLQLSSGSRTVRATKIAPGGNGWM